MGTRASVRAAALAALLLALLALPAAALPRKGETWLRLQSPHFTIFSNAGERKARQVAGDLEQLRFALAQLNPELELASPVPTWIYVFKDSASFRPYQPLYQGRPRAVGGYFVPHPFGNYVAINADPRSDATKIVYHEYLHYILGHNYTDLPLWLNEGLAEYYSTFEVVGHEARIGRPVPEHVLWFVDNAILPLRELVSMDHDSPPYNEGMRQGSFYAQSWALVHLLLSTTPERRQQMAQYLHDVLDGMPGDQAFEHAFGNLALLERDLRAYIRRPVFDAQRLPVAQSGELRAEVAPLAWPDVLYHLGEILLNMGSPEQRPAAESHFRAVLEAAPRHGPATAGLGRIAEAAGRTAEARAAYVKATQLAPDDFFLHYLLGRSLLQPELAPEDRPQARAAFQRTVELRPDFAEAWGRLAQVVADQADLTPETLKIFETAWRLLPTRPEFAFNLALAYAETGETAKAEALIEQVLVPRNRPELAEKAREALVLGAWRQIEDGLIKPGRLAEAVPALDALRQRTPSPERREALQRRIEEIEDVLDYNGFADRYNRAIELLNAGRDTDALALLEELSARTRNPGQAAEARKLLERVKAGPRVKG